MLNKPPAGWTGATGYVSKDLLASTMPAPSDDNLIMVCGPPGMVRPPALAGWLWSWVHAGAVDDTFPSR